MTQLEAEQERQNVQTLMKNIRTADLRLVRAHLADIVTSGRTLDIGRASLRGQLVHAEVLRREAAKWFTGTNITLRIQMERLTEFADYPPPIYVPPPAPEIEAPRVVAEEANRIGGGASLGAVFVGLVLLIFIVCALIFINNSVFFG